MESHLRQALVRAHQDYFTRDTKGLESALYREHVEGREFLGLAIYDDEDALTSATRGALLTAFGELEAAYAERPATSLRVTTVSEFVSIGLPVVSGMAARLRSAPAGVAALEECLTTIARELVDTLSPSRVLVGHTADDPGLVVFICDTRDEIDLPRYMVSPTRARHMRALSPLLVETPRWFSLDPTWRYFRGRRQG
jgi:hypothetical protein